MSYRLADGFAFAREEETNRWQQGMKDYLETCAGSLRVLLVVDARQSFKASDRDFMLWLDRKAQVPFHVVMSKCDLVPQKELARRYTIFEAE